MLRIIIIGCGNIGFRHFQSILTIRENVEITLFDKIIKNYQIFLQEFDRRKIIRQKIEVKTIKSLNKLNYPIDFAIISTSSYGRPELIKKLFSKQVPKFLILEKFLFQEKRNYNYFATFFKKNNCLVYVNQWMSGEFKFLKKYLDVKKNIHMKISGRNWGLCCNSVHYIDLFKSFIRDKEIFITKNKLRNEIFESKRNGYFELYGNFSLSNIKGDKLTISCNRYEKNLNNISINIYIINEKKKIICKLVENKLLIKLIEGKKIRNKIYNFKYQSERTAYEIKKISSKKKSNLPSYSASIKDHLNVFDIFYYIFKQKNKLLLNKLPIT